MSILDDMDAGLVEEEAAQAPAALSPGESVGYSEGTTTRSSGYTPEQRAAQTQRTNASINRLGGFGDKVRALGAETERKGAEAKQRFGAAVAEPQAELERLGEAQKLASKDLEKADAEYQQAVKGRAEHQARTQNAIGDMDTLAKQIAADDQANLYTNRSVGANLLSSLLLGLGAAAQSLYHDRTNAVADQFDSALQRELMQQRLRMQSNKDRYGNQNLLLGRMMQHYDRVEHAEDAAYVTVYNGVRGRLEALKGMMTNPQMRINTEKFMADMDMKTLERQQRVMTDAVGTDVRMAQAQAVLEQKREAAMSVDTSVKTLNAQTRAQAEQRKQRAEGRDENALEIPGWEFPEGFKGDKTEARKLRDMEATVSKADNALTKLAGSLDKGGALTSYPKWAELKAEANRAILTLKGDGIGDAGKNFTELERTLITEGYLGQDGNWKRALDPSASKRIRAAVHELRNDTKRTISKRGGRPAKNHEYFGEGGE